MALVKVLVPGFQRFRDIFTSILPVVKRIFLIFLSLYIFFLFAEVLWLKWIYSRIHQGLLETGGISVPYLVTALALVLAAVVYSIFPMILWYWITLRRKRALVLFTSLLVGWAVIMYFLSVKADQAGYLFNPTKNGEPRFKAYVEQDGKIELLPLPATHHPQLGVPLQELTPELAREYLARGGLPLPKTAVKKPVPARIIPFRSEPQWVEGRENTNFWVEGIKVSSSFTFIRIGCKGKTGVYYSYGYEGRYDGSGVLLQASNREIWLVDQNQTTYPLAKDLAELPEKEDGTTSQRGLGQGEIYKFWLVFAPLTSEARVLTLSHRQFQIPNIGLYPEGRGN